MNIKNEILSGLKKEYKGAALPRDLEFDYMDNVLYMKLKREAIGFDYYDANNKIKHVNMQEDKAAFEGWAAVIKTYWNTDTDYKIMLCVSSEQKELPSPKKVFLEGQSEGVDKGHYGRFLYRAWFFQEEYNWFVLSEEIMAAADEYKKIITTSHCKNHKQNTEAGVNHHPEIQAELAFHNHPEEIEKLTKGRVSGTIHRQLGCWLESNDEKIQFLTKGRSAIDLWNVTNKTLNIFELKASATSVKSKSTNYKVGIISELFFYAEYCRAMFGKDAIFNKVDGDGRGYEILASTEIEKVEAYYLTNHYHPLLKDDVVKLLNRNKSGIEYIKLPEYDYDYIISLK